MAKRHMTRRWTRDGGVCGTAGVGAPVQVRNRPRKSRTRVGSCGARWARRPRAAGSWRTDRGWCRWGRSSFAALAPEPRADCSSRSSSGCEVEAALRPRRRSAWRAGGQYGRTHPQGR